MCTDFSKLIAEMYHRGQKSVGHRFTYQTVFLRCLMAQQHVYVDK